ncbi:DUF2796 domain-containing protein [Motilimonas sp. 1_MG-2023]|uniref:ZrgA family zinc uptake protein n=1 Tax=Motilimonas sp. 1_MG-2023 TaxID=3062672 RepID=UPI0026E230D0|nr:DUF2796 domain-containing protein [Motilimonas sp. 1_MG-2023]MDO6525705.1 DUF2796 domain-containing protein [Motilimonas sp. 1_MG-2023]
MQFRLKKIGSLSFVALACISSHVLADDHEHRAHGSHEHGAANIDLVLEGNELAFDWMSPAANLLGFEHQAKNDEQKQKLAEVASLLAQPKHILVLPDAAGCKVTEHNIDSELFTMNLSPEKHNDKHHDDEHHDSEHHDDEHHDSEHHDDEHHDGEHHDGEHHDSEHHDGEHHDDKHHEDEHQDAHSDVTVSYHFECANPDEISSLSFSLFDHFSLTEKVQIQGIINSQQMAKTLTPKDHSLTW